VSATIQVIATVKDGMSLLRLGGLKVGRTPAWFRRIVERDFGGSFHADWFDHPATDDASLVVEPYDLNHDDLNELLSFANQYALNVSISAVSQHHPTRTLTVRLTPRKSFATGSGRK
jgi:hypothetical protein